MGISCARRSVDCFAAFSGWACPPTSHRAVYAVNYAQFRSFTTSPLRSFAGGSFAPSLAISLPHFPRRGSGAPQTFQFLLVFKRIHACPETIVAVADQLLFFDQSVE